VTDTAQSDRTIAVARSGWRRRWVIATISGVLVTAMTVAAIVFICRYAYARPLSNDGGSYGWESPDDVGTRFDRVGESNGLTVLARPGASQSFYFEIRNDSPVTQEILGLANAPANAAWQEHLSIATKSDYRLAETDLQYRSGPIALPPHADRFIRLTVDTPRCPGSATQFWDSVRLRVRVGAFTSTQTMKLGTTIFQIRPSTGDC
jgi:hypothetical protein